jgi:hypothetical protein
MCCFSQPVEHVGATNIFARPLSDGRQQLVYSMNVRVRTPLAMILPLPVPLGASDNAVKFIDLSGYPHFFEDMRNAFPPMYAFAQSASRGMALSAPEPEPKLVVHKIGAFEASFVPSLAAFTRLDERFRIAPEVWLKLPEYADYGFAVFQLAPQTGWFGRIKPQTVHPMAFEFPRRNPDELFFPTVHIHDGVVHPTATFDHTLYCQVDGVLAASIGWSRSRKPLGEFVNELKSRGVVRSDLYGYSQPLDGELPNRDTIVRPPRWAGGPTEIFGDCWAVRVHCQHANYEPDRVMAERRLWPETSRQHLDKIFAALRDGIPELVARYRDEWKLAPYPGQIPSFWPSRYPEIQKPGAFLFMGELYTKRVEHQEVALCFSEPPSAELERKIQNEIRALLDRALD